MMLVVECEDIESDHEVCLQSRCQNQDPEMLSTSHFYDGNVINMVWKDTLA